MTKVRCQDCIHFRRAPYEANRTGCWHPDNMPQKHKESFLDQQQQPGNHEKINLRGDCPQYEAKPAKPPFWKGLVDRLLGRTAMTAVEA